MPTGIDPSDDDIDLSSTCITLSEFKSQWLLILQRGRVASQICRSRAHFKTTPPTPTPTAPNRNNETASSSNQRFDTQHRLRKRRRLGRRNQLWRGSHEESLEKGDGSNNSNKKSTTTDPLPFDRYHPIKIPSSHDAIDLVVDDVIAQWRALDERKISAAVLAGMHPQQQHQHKDTARNNNNNNKALPKWYEKHVRLPDGFDYASVRKEPPPDDHGGESSDRVIDFMDPTQTLSYHTELWKLFQSIPTRQQIEESICQHHQLPNTDRWFRSSDSDDTTEDGGAAAGGGGQGGGAIIQGTKSCPSTDWDFYGLSRFRLNDRHDLPPPPPPMRSPQQKQQPVPVPVVSNDDDYCGLIRLECLRKQLRRTSTPDPNRMVLEFLGTQTLYDVHCAIVELTDDELWYESAKTVPISSISLNDTNNEDDAENYENENENDHATKIGDESIARNTTWPLPEQEPVQRSTEDATTNATTAESDCVSSGYFLIENTFYTTGTVDYTTPIIRWLQTGTAREQKRRMEHLGIGPTVPIIKSMTDTKLYDLPTRFGVRYVHVHHGDVECAIFVTDRRLLLQEQIHQIHQFPILHDIWTSSYSIPECDICQTRVAVIATSTECDVTNGHAALCEECCRQLRLPQTSRQHMERYAIWRGQSDVSAGASNEVAW